MRGAGNPRTEDSTPRPALKRDLPYRLATLTHPSAIHRFGESRPKGAPKELSSDCAKTAGQPQIAKSTPETTERENLRRPEALQDLLAQRGVLGLEVLEEMRHLIKTWGQG